jgi:hypothetical protein
LKTDTAVEEAGTKSGLAFNEVLFVLTVARALHHCPDVAFVFYARGPTAVVAREPAWNVVPDLASERLGRRPLYPFPQPELAHS